MNTLGEGVAGRNGQLRRASEDGSVIAGWRLGGSIASSRSAFALTLFQTLSKRETTQKWERDSSRTYDSRKGEPIGMFWGDFDNILIAIAGVAKTGSSCRKGPMQ
jgi:hypothetical protein